MNIDVNELLYVLGIERAKVYACEKTISELLNKIKKLEEGRTDNQVKPNPEG